MGADFLGPFWQLLFGVSLLLFLGTAMRWRSALHARGYYLPLVALFMFPLGFFLLSRAAVGGSFNRASPLLMAGTGVLFVGALLIVLHISKLARPIEATGASKP